MDEIDHDDCGCLVWFRIINEIFAVYTKTGTPFFHWLIGYIVLTMYDHNPAKNSGLFNTFRWQKLDKASLILNSRILQHEYRPLLITRQLDGAGVLYHSLWSLLRMRVPVHFPIHNDDSNHIPRCLATFPFSGTGKYANRYVIMRLRTFSFEHHLYLSQSKNSYWMRWSFDKISVHVEFA